LRNSQVWKIEQQRCSTGLPKEQVVRLQPSRCGQVRQLCGWLPSVLAMRSWRSLSMAGDFVVTAMPSSTATAQEVRMPAVPAISTTQRLQPLSPPPRWQEGGRSGWAHSAGI
jgi:hypothetical protein